MTTIRKAYVDGPFGQIHVRETAPVAGRAPLVCLHATAYSSRSFAPLMSAYAGTRQLIAIDAPGYGGSDRPAAPIDIAGYADAVAAVIEQRSDRPVELLGYHTGAYIAADLAIRRPDLVEALVLIGIPYFEVLDRDAWYAKLARRHRLADDLGQFEERWDYLVMQGTAQGITLPRAFGNFVDELAAWPHGWWAHEAMFAWNATALLPAISRPVRVPNPAGHLAEPSRVAAALIPGASVIEMPDVTGPVLEIAPDRLRDAIEAPMALASRRQMA